MSMATSLGDDKGRLPKPKPLAAIIRRSLLVSAGVLAAQPALIPAVYASPQGGAVVAGQGSIARPNAATTVIHQQSNSLAINWQSFNLDKPDLVRFSQPSAQATALNRVLDQNPSQIFGTIRANGRVFLLNPNGVIFGRSARVQVGSLFAGTLDISNEDFMAGRYQFSAVPGKESSTVVNRGLIQAATGGSVSLVGGSVSNEGVIVADLGYVNLAAGRKAVVDFDGDGLMTFQVDGKVVRHAEGVTDAVKNSGRIQAQGGRVLLSAQVARDVFTHAVNNSGLIRAGKIEKQGGVVRLVGAGGPAVNTGTIDVSASAAGTDGGTVSVQADSIRQSGTIKADAAHGNGGKVVLASADTTILDGDSVTSARSLSGGKGGTVQALGDHVGILDRAKIDVSGDAGGGTALVGGDFHGANPAVRNASRTYVGPDATISADAGSAGDGGKVVVWSDDVTRYYGAISARGGATGGDGGAVEVSGKGALGFYGHVDTSAPAGALGTLLLDPTNINVVSVDPSDGSFTSDLTTVDQFTDPDMGTNLTSINVASINGSASVVTLQATNDITLKTSIGMTKEGAGITMQAGNDIALGAFNITTIGGAISLTANSTASGSSPTGTGSITSSAGNLTTTDTGGTMASGSVTLATGAGTGSITVGNIITTGVDSASANGLKGGNVSITAANGNISTGTITTSGGNTTATAGTFSGGDAGTISVAITSASAARSIGTGALTATGGTTVMPAAGNAGGNGGKGATVTIAGGTGTQTSVTVGAIDVSGQAGAQGGGSGDNGGTGGDAGDVVLSQIGGGGTFSATSITMSGGAGGASGGGGGTAGTPGADGSATLAVGSSAGTVTGVIAGGALTKQGTGKLTLSGTNTYTGTTTVSAGVLDIQDASALGAAAAGTTVDSGAALEIQGGITIASEALTLNGSGISSGGALRSVSGTNAWGGAITLGSAARVNSDAGTLALSGGVDNGGFPLTVGGAGDTTVDTAAISGSGGLTKDGAGILTLSVANTYTGATSINAGTAAVTVDQALGTNAAGTTVGSGGTLDFQSVNYTKTEAITLGGGTLRTSTGTSKVAGNISLSADSAVTQADGTDLTLSGTINGAKTLGVTSGTGNITFGGAIGGTTALSGVTVNSAGTATFNAVKVSGNISVAADGIDFTGGAGTVQSTGGGSVTLQPKNDADSIDIGSPAGGSGMLKITDTDIAALKDGFGGIVIGRATGKHDIVVGSATFTDPVTIQTPSGGSIAVNGQITGTGNASVTLDGSGATTTLAADIVTSGSDIHISDNVLLAASTVTLDTGSGGGKVQIDGTVNADDATTNARALTVTAGTGSVTLSGDAGTGSKGQIEGGVSLSGGTIGTQAITTTSALNNQAGGDVTVTGSGAVTIGGAITAQGLGSGGGGTVKIDGAGASVQGVDTTGGASSTAGGAIELNNNGGTGTVTLNGDLTAAGQGAGGTGGALTVGTAALLGASLAIDTSGTTSGGAVSFTGTLGGAHDLTLNAGNGTVDFNGAVSNLGDGTGAALIVQNGSTGLVHFHSTVGANSGLTSGAATSVRFDDNITLANGDTGTNLAGAVQLDGLTFSGFDGLTLGALTLSGGPVTLDSKGGNIGIASIAGGGQNLTLGAGIGAGTTTVTGNVSNLGTGTGAALTVDNSATGLVRFEGTFGANSGLSAGAATSVRFDQDVTLASSGTGTNLAGAVQLDGLSFSGSDGLTFGVLTLSGGPVTLDSKGGSIGIASIAGGSQNLTLAAGIGAGTTTVTGNVSNLGSGTGAALTVKSGVTGLVYFKGTVGGKSGLVAEAVTSNLRFDQDMTLTNGNTATTLPGAVQLDGLNFSGFDGLTFGNTTLSGAAQTTLNSNGSDITFTGTLDGSTDFAEDLALTAGAGNIDFMGAVGATKQLGDVTVNSANNVTLEQAFNANSLTQTAGTGTTTFGGAGGGGATLLQGSSVTNALDITTSTITFNDAATASSGDINLDVSQDKNNIAVTLAGLTSACGTDCVVNRDVTATTGSIITAVKSGHVTLADNAGTGTATSPTNGKNTRLVATNGTVEFNTTKALQAGTNVDDTLFPQVVAAVQSLVFKGNVDLGDDAVALGATNTLTDAQMDSALAGSTTLKVSTTGGNIVLDRATKFDAGSGDKNLILSTDQQIFDNSSGGLAFQSSGTLTLTSGGKTVGTGAIGTGSPDGTLNVDVGALVINGTSQSDVNVTDAGTVTPSTTYDVATGGAGTVTLTQSAKNMVLTNVSTTGDVNLTTTSGSIIDTAGADTTTDVTGANLTLSSGSGVGTSATDALDLSVSKLTITSAGGDVFLTEANGIQLGTVNANANTLRIEAIAGDITDATSKVTAGNATLVADGGSAKIGASGTPINTTLSGALTASSGSGGIYISQTGTLAVNLVDAGSGNVELASTVGVTDNNGAANNVNAGQLTVTGNVPVTGLETTVSSLKLTTAATSIANTKASGLTVLDSTLTGQLDLSNSAGMVLNKIDATGKTVNLTAGGAITDGNGASNNVTASALNITGNNAVTGIETAVSQLGLTTAATSITNTGALTVNDSTVTGQLDLTGDSGLALDNINASGQTVNLQPGGATTDNNGTSNNVTAGTLKITGNGTVTDLETTVSNLQLTTAATSINNTGALALQNSTLSGQLDLVNSAGIALDNVSAGGQTVNVTAKTGDITDGNGNANNVSSDKLSLAATAGAIGAGDALETTTGTSISLTSGGAGSAGDIGIQEFNLAATSAVSFNTTGSGTQTVDLTAPSWNVDTGIGNAGDNLALRANTGNITETAGTVTANDLTLQANASGKSIGALGTEINTAAGGTLNASANTGGGGIFINQATGSLKVGAVDANTGNVELLAGGAITDGPATIKANKLTTSSSGGTTLSGNANNVGEFEATNSSSGNVSLQTAGALQVDGITNTVGDVSLTTGGALTQTGLIKTALLTTDTQGGATLNSANVLSSFNATNSGGGNVALTDNGALDITGVTTGGGNLTLNNDSGTVKISGAVGAGNTSITTTTSGGIDGNGGTITSNGKLMLVSAAGIGTGGTVNTDTTGPLDLESGGSSTAGNISINETGDLATSEVTLKTNPTTTGVGQTVTIANTGMLTYDADLTTSLESNDTLNLRPVTKTLLNTPVNSGGTSLGLLGAPITANVTSVNVGGGTFTIGNTLTAGGSFSITGSTALKGSITLPENKTLAFNGPVNVGVNSTLASDKFGFGGSVTGSSNLVIIPKTPFLDVTLGAGSTFLPDVNRFGSYGGRLSIGGTAPSDAAGVQAGNITVNGPLATAGALTLVSLGDVMIDQTKGGKLSSGGLLQVVALGDSNVPGSMGNISDASGSTADAFNAPNAAFLGRGLVGTQANPLTGSGLVQGGGSDKPIYNGTAQTDTSTGNVDALIAAFNLGGVALIQPGGSAFTGTSPLAGTNTQGQATQGQATQGQTTSGLTEIGFIDESVFLQITIYDIAGRSVPWYALDDLPTLPQCNGPNGSCEDDWKKFYDQLASVLKDKNLAPEEIVRIDREVQYYRAFRARGLGEDRIADIRKQLDASNTPTGEIPEEVQKIAGPRPLPALELPQPGGLPTLPAPPAGVPGAAPGQPPAPGTAPKLPPLPQSSVAPVRTSDAGGTARNVPAYRQVGHAWAAGGMGVEDSWWARLPSPWPA